MDNDHFALEVKLALYSGDDEELIGEYEHVILGTLSNVALTGLASVVSNMKYEIIEDAKRMLRKASSEDSSVLGCPSR